MRHIYVHVPFCARRCSYCDFSIAVRRKIPGTEYAAAITQELTHRQDQGEWNDEPTETLYFGGGTPSLLPPGELARLIELLGAPSADGSRLSHPPSPVPRVPASVEVTLEANPDDVNPQAARAWKEAGVNRVSLGAQSFNPAVLEWMHRTHGADAVPRAIALLREAGITELSLDLIFGLPDELNADFGRDLDAALQQAPDHFSVYGLSVESRTPLARWISRGTTTDPSEDRYVREFLLADRLLTAAGYEHYEVSNYSRPGHRSRHNSAYWTERPYAGLGPAAHSFSGTERRWNVAQWTEYERAILGGRDPTAERERLDPSQRAVERLYLGLRTSDGLAKRDWPANKAAMATAWVAGGWLDETADRFRLTPEGWLRLDQIVAVLTTSADGG